jgi:hypothetical protein
MPSTPWQIEISAWGSGRGCCRASGARSPAALTCRTCRNAKGSSAPGEPDNGGPADDIIADPDRQPAGYCDDVRQGHRLANNRVIIGKPLGVGSGRRAKAARSVGLATWVLHRVRAGVAAAQGDDDLAGAVDDDGGDGVTIGLAAVDRRFRDRLGFSRSGDAVGKPQAPDRSRPVAANNIMDQVWRGIRGADVIVADVTGGNRNVMLEIGLAMALGKEVIVLGQKKTLPFDIQHCRKISYVPSNLEDLKKALVEAFRAVSARYPHEGGEPRF